MALTGFTTYTSREGDVWVVEKKDYGDGDIDYYLTDPTGETRAVTMKWESA